MSIICLVPPVLVVVEMVQFIKLLAHSSGTFDMGPIDSCSFLRVEFVVGWAVASRCFPLVSSL